MAYRQRTRRGTGIDRVQFKVMVSPEQKVTVDRMADALGRTQSQIIERLLNLVEIDEENGQVLVAGHVLGLIAEQDLFEEAQAS